MAFIGPDCKEETLSPRSAKVKVCLKCGKLVDWQDVLNLLRKIGVEKRIINMCETTLGLSNCKFVNKHVWDFGGV